MHTKVVATLWARLYLLGRIVGLKQYKKCRCKFWNNVTETLSFSSAVTGEIFQINHQFYCDDKCMIFMLKCNISKKQYVGEITNAFRLRWNNYKDNDWKYQRNETRMQQYLYEHLYSKSHNGFLWNVSTSLIDKTDGFQPKKREIY